MKVEKSKFMDGKLSQIINDIENNHSIRMKRADLISGEIKILEAALKKWNLKSYINFPAGKEPFQLIWCPNDKRLLFQIAIDSKKPLIEMPLEIREGLYESGHLANFFEHIYKEHLPIIKDKE